MKIYTLGNSPSTYWIIEDDAGLFWKVPAKADGWKDRQPYKPSSRPTRLKQVKPYNFTGLGCGESGEHQPLG